MAVYIALISVLLPLAALGVLYFSPNDRIRKLLGSIFAFMNILAAAGLFVLILFINKFPDLNLYYNIPNVGFIIRFINAGVLLVIMIRVLSARQKKVFTAILCAIQIILLFLMEAYFVTKLEGTLLFLDSATAIALMSTLLLGATAVLISLNGAKGVKGNIYAAQIFGLVFFINCAILSNNISWFHFFWQFSFFATYFILVRNLAPEDRAKAGFLLNLNIISGIFMVIGIIMIYISNGTVILTEIANSTASQGSPWYFSYGFGFIMLAVIMRLGMFPFARFYGKLMGVTSRLPVTLLFYLTAFPGLFLMLRIAPVMQSSKLGAVVSAFAAFAFALASFLVIFEKNRQNRQFYKNLAGTALCIALITIGNPALFGLGLVLLMLNAIHTAALQAAASAAEANDPAAKKLALFLKYALIPIASFGFVIIRIMAIEIAAGNYLTSIALAAGYVFEMIYIIRQFSGALLNHMIGIRFKELYKGFGKMRGTLYFTSLLFILGNAFLFFFMNRAVLPYMNNVLQGVSAGILVSGTGIWPMNADFTVIGGGKFLLGYAAVLIAVAAAYLLIYKRASHVRKQEPFLCGSNFISENTTDDEPKFTGPADTVIQTSYEVIPSTNLSNQIDFIALIYILAIFGVLIR